MIPDDSMAKSVSLPEASEYWREFYSSRPEQVPHEPSQFALSLSGVVPPDCTVIDIGCGTGRDSLWWARRQPVLAVDGSAAALEFLDREAAKAGNLPVSIHQADLSDSASMRSLGATVDALRGAGAKFSVYARFLLHAIPREAEFALLSWCKSTLAPGESVHLEYRASPLEPEEYVFGAHYRRPIDPIEVEAAARELGFAHATSQVSDGFAVFKGERPLVARTLLIA